MFVKVTKSGPRRYIQLVQAFRDADGTTRHRHIANLGRVDESESKLDRLIDGLSRVAGRAPPEAPAFERSLEVGGPWVLSGAALHKLKAIQLHRFTAAGLPVSGLTATSDETRTIFQQSDLPLPDQKHLGI